jgi:predicted negative regulator of RcsB-dependent stress response
VNRNNLLFLIIGALVIVVAVLGYEPYQGSQATRRHVDQCRPEWTVG